MSRLFTLVTSAFALIVLSPFLVLICLALRFTGEGEVLYRQRRSGRYGKEFEVLKFATMLKNSEQIGAGLLTLEDDPRVLPVGKILRATKVNELPQLINMLKGDMDVVGPRPLVPQGDAQYTEDDRELIRSVRPGLTGIGSLMLRDEEGLYGVQEDPQAFYTNVIMPYKAAIEVWYVYRKSLLLDLKIIGLTAVAIVFPKMNLELFFKGLPDKPTEFY